MILQIKRRNFDYLGAIMDYELEDGTMLHETEYNGEHYTIKDKMGETCYRPVWRGIGEPDEDGDFEEYEVIEFEKLY